MIVNAMLVGLSCRGFPFSPIERQVNMFHKFTHRDFERVRRLLDVDGSYDGNKLNSCFSSGHLRSSPDGTVPPMPIFPPLRYPHPTLFLYTSFLIPFTHKNLPPC